MPGTQWGGDAANVTPHRLCRLLQAVVRASSSACLGRVDGGMAGP